MGVDILFNTKKKKVMDEGKNNYIQALVYACTYMLVLIEKNAVHEIIRKIKKNQSIMVRYLLVCNTI